MQARVPHSAEKNQPRSVKNLLRQTQQQMGSYGISKTLNIYKN